MAQIFDPLPSDASNPIVCCYVNATSKIQVARITNIPSWYFERVIFPGQRLVFEALPQAQLEIHSGAMASALLTDILPCERLKIETELEENLGISVPPGAAGEHPLEQTSMATAIPTSVSVD